MNSASMMNEGLLLYDADGVDGVDSQFFFTV